MNHLEIELKSALTKEEYQELLSHFEKAPLLEQLNIYFDTKDRQLQEKKMALRIRVENKQAELTLKVPQAVGNMEYNYLLTSQEYRDILDHGVFPECEGIALLAQKGVQIRSLEGMGQLFNRRYEMDTEIGLMALDASMYLENTDYELELEVHDYETGQKNFAQFLEEHGLPYRKIDTKIARFFAARDKSA